MPTFAAVDIGSNSVRLKIAKAVRGRLETLHDDREVTRLGESVFANGTLDPQAMSHTLQVLRRFHREVSRIQKRIAGAKLQISIATSGTPAALSGLYAANIRGYDESKPQTVPKSAVATLLNTLSRRNLAQRRALPGI